MFNREESKQIRQRFWTVFGQISRRKWLLYNTKIKELSLKFTCTTKMAQVSIDIESSDDFYREYYYDKLWSLENILKTEYLPDAILDPNYEIEPGRIVSRVYVQLDGVSIHDDRTWPRIFEFFKENMAQLEAFFWEYSDFIKD
jgi:hypothetical protein